LNFGSPAPNDRNLSGFDVKDLLKDLNAGIHEKVSLLKMLAVKCGEAETSYKKIRQYLVKGDATQADRVVNMLEQMNAITLKDLQSELSTSNEIFEVLAELSDTIQREKRDQSKSISKDRTLQENNMLKRQIDDLQDRLREYELNRTNHLTSKGKDTNMSKIMKDLDDAEKHIEELNRVRDQLEYDNRRLREEIKYLEDNARKRPNSSGRPDQVDA